MRFKPLVDFDCPELRSSYVSGLEYTVRSGDDKLAELVKLWLIDGKIKVLIGSSVAMSGMGEITSPGLER